MKKILGAIMILTGIGLGVYVGLWVCFIGGLYTIVQMFTGALALTFGTFAWAVIKMLFAGVFGWAAFSILVIPGSILIEP